MKDAAQKTVELGKYHPQVVSNFVIFMLWSEELLSFQSSMVVQRYWQGFFICFVIPKRKAISSIQVLWFNVSHLYPSFSQAFHTFSSSKLCYCKCLFVLFFVLLVGLVFL